MKKLLRFILVLIILALVLLGIYYKYKSYFNGTDIKISGPLSINYLNGSKLIINTKKEINISVINSGEDEIKYFVEFINLKNIKKDVEYTIKNDSGIDITDTLNNFNTIVSSYITINPGEEHYYTITFDSSKFLIYFLEINIEIESENSNSFSESIIKNNEIKKTSKTIVGKEIATEDEGLIESIDDYGKTYYFRGNVQNNNVEINGHMFKIVRINGDGTVKLISTEATDDSKKYYESGEDYIYNKTNFPIFLNSWINDTLGKYTTFLSNQKFCNDNVKKGNYYLSYSRLAEDYIPSFVCLGDKVSGKVGLLTADEAVYAGGMINMDNTSYYLYNPNIDTGYYLMTGGKLDNNIYYPFSINTNGNINLNDAGTNVKKVRPVININKIAKVVGTGTLDDPYKLTEE